MATVRDLNVTLIQQNLIWEDIERNLSEFEKKIESITEQTDLIVLPEMFSTGFSTAVEKIAQTMDGSAVNRLRTLSKQTGVDITGSVIIKENDAVYNRLIWAKPDGRLLTYDKRHLFRMGNEHLTFTPGHDRLTVEINGWRIRPFICYDLRFPCWIRNVEKEYDAAIFVANWPASRAFHWKTLLTARAIENQCYVVGVNRVGSDANGLEHSGDSCVIDYFGHTLFSRAQAECIHTETLSYENLTAYREKFPVWMDGEKVRTEC